MFVTLKDAKFYDSIFENSTNTYFLSIKSGYFQTKNRQILLFTQSELQFDQLNVLLAAL